MVKITLVNNQYYSQNFDFNNNFNSYNLKTTFEIINWL